MDAFGVTTYTANSYLAPADIDAAGSGTVNINTGGTVTITGTDNTAYRGVNIGQASGTTGIVNVDGIGSTLTSQGGTGRIRVGNYGTGELNITAGGQVNAFFVDVGRNDGSDGRVTVDGDGSKLTVSDQFGHFPGYGGIYLGEAGFMRLGREAGSYGYLSVTNGGTVDIINDPSGTYDNPFLAFGRNNGATGIAVIDGLGSSLNVVQTGPQGPVYQGGPGLAIGQGGYGKVTVRNDPQINVLGDDAGLTVAGGRYSYVGTGPYGGGIFAPDNDIRQSQLLIYSVAVVVLESLSYRGAQMRIACGAHTYGKAVVDGAGSNLTLRAASGLSDAPQSGTLLVV